ncbi:VOC family protein [Fluviicola taffensis]|uniref:Glyoxalase/bleomycin resistance protein/dioxygenase n=1 Tax=Fluviicola taffensis (strain DSM 16823 / NCIMB 13979 / RW262) TaxID=755732 RepID=F2IFC0_FLUTR|nr:VOC family protein [Fluviicola taffensis]AEA44605.1 Glyoxalase/bleomycin resistance protein/dioxygenase [Fluviicola taffensis DSM 16823]
MRKLNFASLQVRDLEASTDFYTNKLGFELAQITNPDARVFRYDNGEASFAIRRPIGNLDGKELGVGASLWFLIDEKIEDLQARLTEMSVTLLGPVTATPFGKIIVAKDPDGYNITFLQPN